MRSINEISESIRRGERLAAEDALKLWREAPLWLLGELASERKEQVSGKEVYYNRNVHLEPTNICLFNCEFCSFRRREGDKDAWYMSLDDIEARAMELRGADITEVHIVGGVHPKHDLDTYCAMIRRVKRALPHVTVKAYTAVEIFYMIRNDGISVVEGLRRLKEAGMECIPGGGAEIFDATLRKKICPEKCSSEEWLAVHRAAHNMGIPTNCTMLYGHIETLEQRIDHLERLRSLQDEAPGFDAFIPLKYHSHGNRLSQAGECSVEEDLRTIAMSRLFLDNIPHIKAYWVSYGKATTEMALAFGADDIDGTIGDTTKIYSMAGGVERPSMSVEELESMVESVGFTPIERDSHYNRVERNANTNVDAPNLETKVEAPKPQSVSEKIDTMTTKSNTTKPKATTSASKPKSSGNNKKAKSSNKKSGFIGFLRRFPVIANIFYIGIFGIITLVAVYVGLIVGTRHGKIIEVPNFMGMSIEDAEGVALKSDLNLIVRDSIFDVDLPGGTIVDQLPKTSTVREVTVKPGRKIYVTVNAYTRRMVNIPYVAKQTLRQALNQIERSGLTVSRLVYEADMTSTDYVIKQKVDNREILPTTERKAPVGTGVTLHVSYQHEEQNTQTPRLVGLSLQQAKNTLWDNGLNLAKVIYDDSVEDLIARRKARVYKQSSKIGTSLRRGSEVTLYLTCDENLADSMSVIAAEEIKELEKQRRKALEEREAKEQEEL
ncbi:MAG: CofH family radical SAM protein [Alistipes sp.]|nr:CofH family radical SAM protein [Alistipes sp.]